MRSVFKNPLEVEIQDQAQNQTVPEAQSKVKTKEGEKGTNMPQVPLCSGHHALRFRAGSTDRVPPGSHHCPLTE